MVEFLVNLALGFITLSLIVFCVVGFGLMWFMGLTYVYETIRNWIKERKYK